MLIHSSSDLRDPSWDAFLASNPRGQFQQTSRWARVKAREGWQPYRVTFQSEAGLEGGFQLLWRPTRLGRMGYVSKGPVLANEHPEAVARALEQVCLAARTLRLQAIILQPPDFSVITANDLVSQRFTRYPIGRVISATALIDVSGGSAVFEARMSSKTRQRGRQAIKRGVKIVRGERKDLADFFELMCGSCLRQQTKPNPSRLEHLEVLWDEFSPAAGLGFACVGEQKVAGLLTLGHGDRMTCWKKGWNSEQPQAHANDLLHIETLNWAFEAGYHFVDVASLDPGIAQNLLAGKPLTPTQELSRDVFHLRLGGQPKILPTAHILILNPGLRQAFNACCSLKPVRDFLFRHLG